MEGGLELNLSHCGEDSIVERWADTRVATRAPGAICSNEINELYQAILGAHESLV